MKGAPLQIIQGDALERLRELPDESAQCCVTSPPYWGLRDYGHDGQIGLEKTPEEYVGKLVAMFREVRRVLKNDGTLWLNLGDSYAGSWGAQSRPNGNDNGTTLQGGSMLSARQIAAHPKGQTRTGSTKNTPGLKPKDLVGIPWMAAFALRADGWYLRSEITWCKKVPMPESVTDRPTSATEKIFLLSKSSKYFYDADAVRNPPSEGWHGGGKQNPGDGDKTFGNGRGNYGLRTDKPDKQRGHSRRHAGFNDRWDAMEKAQQCVNGSNMRNFWLLGPDPYSDAHFATFPREVPKRCIMAGSKPGDTILDPFGGSGTTGQVALELARKCILIELNPDYIKLINRRPMTYGLAL